MTSRRTLGVGLAAAAAIAWQHWRPSPCPYATRWVLRIPRPYLTVKRLLALLKPLPGERVLEVGPGIGYHSLAVARSLSPGGRLDAFDIQQEMLDALLRRAQTQGIDNIEPTLGDGRRLPYADAGFDAAFLVTVLGEIPDQDLALRELRRVLRPGGRLVVGEIPALDPHFVRFPVLRKRAAAAGLAVDERRGPSLAFLARFIAV